MGWVGGLEDFATILFVAGEETLLVDVILLGVFGSLFCTYFEVHV